MARNITAPIQQYRGTTEQHASYTGAIGELTVDTDKTVVVVHNGSDVGGVPMARDDSVVHLTGAETITGNKTFNADIFMTPTNLERNIQFTGAYVKGSAAPSSVTGSVWSVETFGASASASPGNNRVSRIGMEQGNTDVSCFMQLNQPVASSTTTAAITIRWPYGDDTEPYATAPATRSSPISTEIVTVGYLQSVLGTTTYDMPLYFDTDNGEYEWGEVHTFVPTGVTTVQLVAIEADGSGTTDLGITMELDIGTGSSLTITSTATSCSDFAGRAVVFSVSGTSDQTEIAALLRFS